MATVKVTAQYRENYGTPSNPHWKAKGASYFSFPIDDNTVMYAQESELVTAIGKMLTDRSNERCKFEYINHTVRFTEEHVVDGLEEVLARMRTNMEVLQGAIDKM